MSTDATFDQIVGQTKFDFGELIAQRHWCQAAVKFHQQCEKMGLMDEKHKK